MVIVFTLDIVPQLTNGIKWQMMGKWRWTIYVNKLDISGKLMIFIRSNLEELAEAIDSLLSVIGRLWCSEKELLKVRYNKPTVCDYKQWAYLP